MKYCPPNTTLSQIINGNVNICFIDTLIDPVILLVSLVGGLHQYKLYYRFSTPLQPASINKSVLYNLQWFLHVVAPLLGVGIFATSSAGYGLDVTGLGILNLITGTLPWILAGVLLGLERGRQLPVSARHGHGPVLLIYWTLALMQVNVRLSTLTQELWWPGLEGWTRPLHFVLYCATYLVTCLIFILGLKAPGLLHPHQYQHAQQFAPMEERPAVQSASTWSGFFSKIGRLLPYMWPKNSPLLQFRVLVCVLLLIVVRVTNVLVPMYYKKIVDRLADVEITPDTWPWQEVSIWMLLKFLQGGGAGSAGLLNNLRSLLWIAVQQFTSLHIQVSLMEHMHNLSLRWHLGRKTGEVLRIVDRGQGSVNSLLNYLLFSIVPTFIDVTIAVVYFWLEFNVYFGLIVLGTMILYLAATFAITEWRTQFRRNMNLMDNKQRARGVDSLLNAETVKYYSMEEWEVLKYKESILDYQVLEWKNAASLQCLNLFQVVVINGGLYVVAMYCAYMVASKEHTVGDFVLLGTYFIQLMGPLGFLGTVYRMIQESFINMENMFSLMEEEVEVTDQPNALSLPEDTTPPEIEFRNVSFHYTETKPVLENINFVIKSGTVTAVVGATGCGKSTLAKLLFRFFDVTEGGILINGHNVKTCTKNSYRSKIGVVPQDTVLFNDTIRYNVSYGRIGATQDQIEEAAKMAEIHETIKGFPDAYDTVVGERGLKLSGGEKQRIAIARTLLKNPSIMIFDEATSSLDTETELNIQAAIESVAKERTSLIIAHRLSTVKRCDQILVLDHGRIVEHGTHAQLIQAGGRYMNLWAAQSQGEQLTTAEKPTEENKPTEEDKPTKEEPTKENKPTEENNPTKEDKSTEVNSSNPHHH